MRRGLINISCILLLLVITIGAGAQNVASSSQPASKMTEKEATDFINQMPVELAKYEKLIKEGHYKEALTLMNKADAMFLVAINVIDNNQLNNVTLKVELEKKQQLMKMLAWKNDSLQLSFKIAEEKNKKEAALRLAEIKQMQISKAQQDYVLTSQRTMIEQARNKEVAKKMQDLKQQRDKSLLHLGIILSGVLLVLAIAIVTVISQKRRAIELGRRKVKAERAREAAQQSRIAAIAARKKADEASTMKMVFIQNMSHEIRTPLNAIVGFSQIFADSSMNLDEASKEEFSTLIAGSSDLMTTLINDILDLSNLTSGQYKMKYSQTTVLTMGNAAYTTVKYRTPPGVTMSFDLPEDKKDITLWTDSRRVEQVLINYFTNACKYTTEGSIRLTYHIGYDEQHTPTTVCYSVTDTGSGIPAEKAESVFRRFEKLDDFKQGNGLGLNICRTIAERLGARCWLDTSYHDGARFFFEMPVLLEEPHDEMDKKIGDDSSELPSEDKIG